MSRHLEVRDVLQTIVASARELLDAEYAALGVPDDHGGFAQFVVDGVSDEQWKAIGPLPRQHGILAAMLHEASPSGSPTSARTPASAAGPPPTRTCPTSSACPSRDGDEILGALFLANKRCPEPTGGCGFTEEDEELLGILAQHAAIALTNARLYERSRELTIAEERARLAHELHDAVGQKLFSLRLTAQAAAALVDRDPARAKDELHAGRRPRRRGRRTSCAPPSSSCAPPPSTRTAWSPPCAPRSRSWTAPTPPRVTFDLRRRARAARGPGGGAAARRPGGAAQRPAALRRRAASSVTLARSGAGAGAARHRRRPRLRPRRRPAARAGTSAWSPCGTAPAASAAASTCDSEPGKGTAIEMEVPGG